jgi:uncharacterized protein (DUF433 family)
MASAKIDIYGNRDPRELPAYPLSEAARYLGVPLSTLRAWTIGQRGFKSIIALPSEAEGQLSFYNFIEAFVVNGLRRKHRVPLQRLRRCVRSLRSLVPHSKHPLADLDLQTFARDVFFDSKGDLVNVTREGQLGLREILGGFLERVEKDPSGAVRLYPLTRPEPSLSPRLIVIDPRISFGRPVIAGTGIPTAVIHDRWKGGDSVAELADDYNRTPEEIEEALRYEAA